MIVKCDQCQTRFKIPDEKVTEKGVKVRCTKCQHTFRVKRASTEPTAATLPAASVAKPPEDPFAQFAEHADDRTRPIPNPYTGGGGARPLNPSYDAQKHLPSEVFEVPTRVGPIPSALSAQLQGATGELPSGRKTLETPRPAFATPPPLRKGGAPPAETATVPAASPAMPDFFAAPPAPTSPLPPADSPSSLLGDLPPADELFGAPAAGREEPFGLGGLGPPEGGGRARTDASDRTMFDMPAPPPPRPASEDVPPPPSTLGRLKIVPQVHSVSLQEPETSPGEAGGAAKRMGGLLLNVGFAAALLFSIFAVGGVYLNEGSFELSSLSLGKLSGLWSDPPELLPVDISNGLYETRAGRPVFFVRGEVHNRGQAGARVKVRAEILDGEQLIRAAEGYAGATPTPEDLFALDGKPDLDALTARLEKAATPVPAGERRPFVVAFHEYPPDLSGLRLKVLVISEGPGSTAAR